MRKATYRLDLFESMAALFSRSIPRFASRPDDLIGTTARQSYVFRSFLKGDDIQMLYENGVVTLIGTVSDESHRALARETVASLPGVAEVKSKLKEKGEIPAVNTDAWLIAQVKSTLWFHQNVNASEIEVIARDGTVTLCGKATSVAQKNLATEYARDVEGVTKVKNEMTVFDITPPAAGKPLGQKKEDVEFIDDASVTGLVKTTLLYHRSTRGLKITVETKEGVVRLEGKTKSWAEKYLISKLVTDVHGVKMVFNNMTVESIVSHDHLRIPARRRLRGESQRGSTEIPFE